MNFLKKLLTYVLVFQLVHTNFATAQQPNVPTQSNAEEASELAAQGYRDESDRKVFEKVESMADAVEQGSVPRELEETPVDIAHFGNQRVEIIEKGKVVKTIHLNQVRAKYEEIAVTELRPVYNQETRELIIEGVIGVKRDGTGGTVKARHIIPDLDILAMNQSNEFIVFMSPNGEVSALDMGYVTKQVFKNPIFVVKNIWKPKEPVELKNAKIKFMTPGTDPLNLDAYTGYIYTVDEEGAPRWFNGDVRITTQGASGKEEVFALLPRSHFYLRTELLAAMILAKLALLDPSSNSISVLKRVLEKAEKIKIAPDKIPGGYDQTLKTFIANIEPDQIKALSESQGLMNNYSKRRFGDQTLSEAIDRFQHIKVNTEKIENPFSEIEYIEKNWNQFVPSQKIESPFRRNYSDVLSDMITKYSNEGSILAGIGILSALYIGFPFAYEQFDWSSVKLLNWFYLNGLPDVLNQPYTVLPRDIDGVTLMEVVNYRYYNILNIIALVMLWPAAHVAAYSYKKVLNGVHSVVKNSNTHFAAFIREMQKNWGGLSNWQVVTSFGMRVYSKFIYPVVRIAIEKVFRQKSFFMAIENWQNPLRRISKNSEEGKRLGLEQSVFLGLNNPLSSSQKLKQTEELQQKAQVFLKVQKMKRSQMAFTLATLTVSENYGIDPATLLGISSGEFQIEDLSRIFNDRRKKQEWYLAAQKIYDQISKNSLDIKDSVHELPISEFVEQYESAKRIAEKIHANSRLKNEAQTLWIKFKRLPFFLMNNMPFVSGGVSDYKFLNSIYTNRFVSGQVHKEFYIDHLMVVGIVNLTPGADGRANYSQPQNLAADPNGILYASGPHLNDTGANTYVHFFVSGAKTAMVYQAVKAHADEFSSHPESQGRNNYVFDPYEDFEYLTQNRVQGFFSSTYEWSKSLLTFTESKLGNYMLKSLKRRLTTLQGGFLTFLIFQMALIDNRLFSDALMAYGLMFSAAYWKYAWPWEPVQRGNSMIENRFSIRQEALKNAKKNLIDAMKDSGNEDQLKNAYKNMFELYEAENPEILARLRSTLKIFDKSTKNEIIKKTLEGDGHIYYGVMVRLAEALRDGDSTKITLYKEMLQRILISEGAPSKEILEISAKGIFDLARSHSPLYTEPNGLLSSVTTLGAAIGTTVLAISLMTETTDLVNKPTFEYVMSWVVANFFLFGGAYLAFGAEPWKFYLKKWNDFKEKVIQTRERLRRVRSAPLDARSCSGYFGSY